MNSFYSCIYSIFTMKDVIENDIFVTNFRCQVNSLRKIKLYHVNVPGIKDIHVS